LTDTAVAQASEIKNGAKQDVTDVMTLDERVLSLGLTKYHVVSTYGEVEV